LETKGDKNERRIQNQPSAQHGYDIDLYSLENGSSISPASSRPYGYSGSSTKSLRNSSYDSDSPHPKTLDH